MGDTEDFQRALKDGDFKKHTWFFYGGIAGFFVGWLLLRYGSPIGTSISAVCFFLSAKYAIKAGRALNLGKDGDSLTTREYEDLDPHQRLARTRRVAVMLVTLGVFMIGLDVVLAFARAGSPHTETVFHLLGFVAD